MYDELVKRLRRCAVYLPEKLSKNAELLDVLMKAADAIERLELEVAALQTEAGGNVMGKEYIEREADMAAACKALCHPGFLCPDFKCAEVRDAFNSIPAADVRPVVRGKWTRIDYEPHGHDYKCSACGWKNDMPTHFCPNCGEKMEES